MASLPRPEAPKPYTMIRSLKWSSAEKVIARKAFEQALQQDQGAIIRQAKKMAARVEQPSDLWELERYLTEHRKEIDRQYDYRYSVLLNLFADLIQKGRLREQDLQGLSEEKLRHIRQMAQPRRPFEL
jgi:Photoprotection regulator fluorescence recovery protein